VKNILIGVVIIVVGFLLLWLGMTGGAGIGPAYYLGFLLMLGGGFFITWSFYSKARVREKEQFKEILRDKEKERG